MPRTITGQTSGVSSNTVNSDQGTGETSIKGDQTVSFTVGEEDVVILDENEFRSKKRARFDLSVSITGDLTINDRSVIESIDQTNESLNVIEGSVTENADDIDNNTRTINETKDVVELNTQRLNDTETLVDSISTSVDNLVTTVITNTDAIGIDYRDSNTNGFTFMDLPLRFIPAFSILAASGLVYSVPTGYTVDANVPNVDILVIDPDTRQIVKKIPITGIQSRQGRQTYWNGGIIDPVTGIIYGSPNEAHQIIMIDTRNNDDVSLISIHEAPENTERGTYTGCVYHQTGRIYFMPYFTNRFMVYDTTTGLVSYITKPSNSVSDAYSSCGIAPNGKLYCTPGRFTNAVIVIDPNNDDAVTQIPYDPNDGDAFLSCVPHNDFMYMHPANTNIGYVLVVDTLSDVIVRGQANLQQTKSPILLSNDNTVSLTRSLLTVNGSIYTVPSYDTPNGLTEFLEVNPSANTSRFLGLPTELRGFSFHGNPVNCLNTAMFCVASGSDQSISRAVIFWPTRTTDGLNVPLERVVSAFYNKY